MDIQSLYLFLFFFCRKHLSVQTNLYSNIYIYIYIYKKRNDMFTTFSHQILSSRLLLVVIVEAKKVLLVLGLNLNQ